MLIVGLNDVAGAHHNSSVALVEDGQILFGASEERFSRIKFDMSFPQSALQAALDFRGVDLSDVDYFAVGYPPSSFYLDLFGRKIWDLPRSLFGLLGHNFLGMMKYLVPNFSKMYKTAVFQNGLKDLGVPDEKIVFMDHHLSHAASAYRCSGFSDCLTISMDGFGPNGAGKNIAGQAYACSNGNMTLLEEIPLYATALWYSAFTVCLGLKYMDGEGKTMGLAAYGDPDVCYDDVKDMVFRYKNGEWIGYPNWIDYIMVPRDTVFINTKSGRRIMKLIEKHGKEHVAAAAQKLLEERILDFFVQMNQKHPFRKIALAGGTFLNVKVNKLILDLPFVDEIFVHPHASDGGTAMGAALQLYHEKTGEPTIATLKDSNLGVEFSDEEILDDLKDFSDKIEWQKLDGELPEYVACALTDGKVVGWFQGREEWGPRALGRRSVLADPRDPKTRDKINSQMKNRDWFMPFAPSCLEDKGASHFKNFCPTPFMTLAFDVVKGKEGDVASAIHVDNTARVHSVRPENKKYYETISHFYEKTGVPVILNTSFNRHGLPIVHRPKEAVEHLLWGCVHELAIGSFIVRTKENSGRE
jgi:carbamoyltransferase